MVVLSRPRHFVLFGLALVGLFAATFQVTSLLVHGGDEAALPLSAPDDGSLRIRVAAPPEPDPGKPDLVIDSLRTRECVTTNPSQPGGTLTVVVRNAGVYRTGGFRLFVETQVENTQSGVSIRIVRDVYEENVAVGEERTYTILYAFPVEDLDPVGPLVVNEPVPGSYRLTTTLDRPTDPGLSFLGPGGVLEESDESNNAAQVETTGTAQGLC